MNSIRLVFLFIACAFSLPKKLSLNLIPSSPPGFAPVALSLAEKLKASQSIIKTVDLLVDKTIALNNNLFKTRDDFSSKIFPINYYASPSQDMLITAYNLARDLHKLGLYYRLSALPANFHSTDSIKAQPKLYFYNSLFQIAAYVEGLELHKADKTYVFSKADLEHIVDLNFICAVAEYEYLKQ